MERELLEHGIQVFGSVKKFLEWYGTLLPYFGKAPCEMDHDEVDTILGRIEYGVYS